MLRVGLTGSMATGKSTVLAAIQDLGVPTHSADAAVHALYHGRAAPPIGAAFAGTLVDGAVDRGKLAAALALAPERMGELEAIVHPLVREETEAFLARAADQGADMAVIEVPLLLEMANPYALDRVIVTACDPAIQRKRALERPGMTQEKFEMLLARQLDQNEKMARADHVIDTSGTMDDTLARTRRVVDDLRSQMRGESPDNVA